MRSKQDITSSSQALYIPSRVARNCNKSARDHATVRTRFVSRFLILTKESKSGKSF
ncbi:hypothetical protein HYC85_029427 [Camellia sinensis]|uniref:Uncharacterized protein n=1 Tax=Camellia sinensis TaxID=4442 RepID=A0A7J7G1Z7_CAMSI|nr:hypothetical protein HYC85_029427 [Camellia sinensis]